VQKEFFTKRELERHNRREKNELKFECDICRSTLEEKNQLRDHLCIHTGEKRHNCDMCNKKFRFKSVLNRHKGAVHTEQTFKYKSALYLRRHSKAKHDRPSEWSTMCTCELFYGLLYTVAVYIVFLGKLWFKKCLAGLFGNFYIFVTFLDICC
jgi:hypothetical protein